MKLPAFVLVWSLVAAFLPAQKIDVDYQKGTDFSQYQTYGWAELDRLPIIRAEIGGEGKLTDQELDRRIRSLVEEQLARKGFQKAVGTDPDFRVSYLAVAKFDLSKSGIDAGAAGYGARLPDGHWRPFYDRPDAYSYALVRQGSLAIDILDAKTNALVWRGTARQTFEKPQQVQKKLGKVVEKIMRKFPPR